MRDEFSGQRISFVDGVLVHVQRVLRWIEARTRPSYWAKWNPWQPRFCCTCGRHLLDHVEVCPPVKWPAGYCGLCGRLERNHGGIYH